MGKKMNIVFFILLIMVICFSNVFAAEVNLAWDSSPSNPDGYRIHYGTSPGNYTQTIDVGNVTEYMVSELQTDVIYYFVVSAYNEFGESGYSNEAQWPTPMVSKPVGLRLIK